MGQLVIKSFGSPDETRPFKGHGHADVVTLAGRSVLKTVFEPGWRWSNDVAPIAGTDSCQATHLAYCIAGRMRVVMDDGTEGEFGPEDEVRIDPGHDAWTVGDEPCVLIDFGGYAQYAKE